MSSTNTWPECQTLLLEQEGRVLFVRLNRPKSRNAMSFEMVKELVSIFDSLEQAKGVDIVVLRGAGGHFCAGGDIKDMASVGMAGPVDGEPTLENDVLAKANRQFGAMISKINASSLATISILEGAVLGGGFGLACVTDVAIAHKNAAFGLPETSLGVPPAQIAPFITERLGLTQARRLAVTGGRFDGIEAERIGLAHFVCENDEAIEAQLEEILMQIQKCAPSAMRQTKGLILRVGAKDLDGLLDDAALGFSSAARGEEGKEGMMAFIEKRRPFWAQKKEDGEASN